MKKRNSILVAMMIVVTFALSSCGNSVVSSTSEGSDVGFDPSKDAILQTLHYYAIQEKLIVDFGLTPSSSAVGGLRFREAVFNQSLRDYSSLFYTTYATIMAKACEESTLELLFPEGPTIAVAWKRLTHRPTGEASKELEKEILKTVGNQPDDVKKFALCLAVALDARTVFPNYVEAK